MLVFVRSFLFFCAVFLSTPIAYAQEALSQPRELMVPWEVLCTFEAQVSDNPTEQCRMAQSLITSETQQPVLLARVFSEPEPIVLLTVPLNVFLKPGITMQIDSGKRNVFGFEICNEEGCHTGIPLSTDLLNALKAGLIARLTYLDANGVEITLPIDLRGFSKSWTELNNAQK